MQAPGLKVDYDENTGEIQHRGEDRPKGDLTVGDAHVLGHKERRRAHDRRHDLASGGGRRLHGAGEFRPVARFLHHRDRDRAGGDGVAHAGAGYHAAQSGGDHGHLGRTAGIASHQGVGEVDEKLRDPRTLQESPENDEYDDVFGTDIDGGVHHAGGGIEKVVDHLAETYIIKGVGHQGPHYAQNGDTHTAAAQLHVGQDGHHGHHHHFGVGGHGGGQPDDALRVSREPEKTEGAREHQQYVVPGKGVDANMLLGDRVSQIAHDQHAAEKDVQPDLRHQRAEQRLPHAVEREGCGQKTHDLPRRPLPDPGVGLAVIFFHHRFHVRGGADSLFRLRSGVRGRIGTFVFVCHIGVVLSYAGFGRPRHSGNNECGPAS